MIPPSYQGGKQHEESLRLEMVIASWPKQLIAFQDQAIGLC